MKKLIAIGILIFEGYLIINLSMSVLGLWQKQGEVDKARARVEKERVQNSELNSQLGYVQSDAYIEKEARNKLNLIRPDETVVIIPKNVLQEATAAPTPIPPPPNWEQWARMFF